MNNDENFFVTGGTGCIGSWVVRNLIMEGTSVAVLDFGDRRHRLELVLDPDGLEKVNFIPGDITDLRNLESALRTSNTTHVIHLAALQLPFCRENPPLGAIVNVVGTTNVFEACRRLGIERVVYASSTAVFGPKEEYPPGLQPHDAHLNPTSHYGVYKQANEGTARVYWQSHGISSIGLRPYVVYGPGRDQGMTSTPTKAMIAAALGRPYKISFGGRFGFEYVDDIAWLFINAARLNFDGAEVFNLGISNTDIREIIAAIERAVPSIEGQISFENTPLPFPEEFDKSALSTAFVEISTTPLETGVKTTIATYQAAIDDGRLKMEDINSLLQT
jgi:UDP-glucuronate 4-epimerase